MRTPALISLLALVVGWVSWKAFLMYEIRDHRLDLIVRSDQVSEWRGVFYEPQELKISSARSLVQPSTGEDKDAFKDPVEPVVDFARRLEARGVELWVIPIPPRPVINASNMRGWGFIGPGSSHYTAPWAAYLEALRARGVTVIDMAPTFQAGAREEEESWVHKGDHHWTNPAIVATAKELAERLRLKGFATDLAPVQTTATWSEVTKGPTGAYRKLAPDETVRVRSIRGERGQPIPNSSPDSPVLVFGDSHVGWYGKWHGDLGRQLSHELGGQVDAFEIHSGGATRAREELARRDWNEPGYIDSKRVIIWTILGTAIRTHEWRIVPLEQFPPSKLSEYQATRRLPTDQLLVDRGSPHANIADYWRTPADTGRGDQTLWLTKRNHGTLKFSGEPRGELVLELGVRKGQQRVEVRLNDVLLDTLSLPKKGYIRHSLPIPDGVRAGIQTLAFKVLKRNGQSGRDAIGLRNATLIRPRHTNRTSGIEAKWPKSASTFELPVHDAKAIRFWVRGRGSPGKLALFRDDEAIATDLPVGAFWREHAIALPISDGTLRWQREDGKFELAWVEVDSVADEVTDGP